MAQNDPGAQPGAGSQFQMGFLNFPDLPYPGDPESTHVSQHSGLGCPVAFGSGHW